MFRMPATADNLTLTYVGVALATTRLSVADSGQQAKEPKGIITCKVLWGNKVDRAPSPYGEVAITCARVENTMEHPIRGKVRGTPGSEWQAAGPIGRRWRCARLIQFRSTDTVSGRRPTFVFLLFAGLLDWSIRILTFSEHNEQWD